MLIEFALIMNFIEACTSVMPNKIRSNWLHRNVLHNSFDQKIRNP